MKGEGEVGGGEDCQSLDEDVGNGLVFGEVGVELVSAETMSLANCLSCNVSKYMYIEVVFQIELIINSISWRDSFSMLQLIGNV